MRCFLGLTRAFLCLFLLTLITPAFAIGQPEVFGVVTDPSGAVIVDAQVELLENNRVVASTRSNSEGQYRIVAPSAARFQLRVTSPHFQSVLLDVVDLTTVPAREANIQLSLQALAEEVTVTATGIPTPQAHLGSAVTVLTPPDFAHMLNVEESLRLIPGLQVSQTGAVGGITSLYIRGGGSDANKVLFDGIPANDIGGLVNFAYIATTGIARVEVLRGPNSALYGSDALAGVVSLTTIRGSTPLPQLTYRVGGGNFGSYGQEGTLGGAYRPFDYFVDFSRFDTANDIPGNQFHNATVASNFGWRLNSSTSLRATLHHDQVASGEPNAIQFYGIPDAAKQQNEDAYFGVTLESQTTPRWQNLLRYGGLRLRSNFTDFAPTGIPQYDQFGDLLDYLGAPVTIHGANGYTVSGQAVYDFVETYPNQYPTSTDRDFVYAQSNYRFNPHFAALFGFEYEDERGYAGGPSESIERGIYDYTFQIEGDWRSRLYYLVGSGIEKNQLFGVAATPRGSLAYELIRPGSGRFFNGTKLRASFGKGIKEPNLTDQESSLYALLLSLPNGPQLISQYAVGKIGAEYSRTYDGGVDQQLFNGRGTVGITYFHNQFTNFIEDIPQQGLAELGVPAPVVAAAPFGATENSQAYRAQGIEEETEYRIGRGLFARGGYTYLDAVIQRSFSSDNIGPSFNPNFPTIPIGAYTPLIGSRPFRQAPHSGYFGLNYAHSRFTGLLTGTLVGRRNDTDFLSEDANGGTTLLLPNRDLDAAYQRIYLSGGYQATRWLNLYSSFQNLFSQHTSEVIGYPSLPFTFTSGIQLTVGGESWKLR
jgi:vitamin B12 transporter